ncbi:hypothetical protein NMY22_g10755 [Coprinellus aureogranulatus]|nr:hypothetical protein NMY22_g10755 [Coprinellus aureogranulatus]
MLCPFCIRVSKTPGSSPDVGPRRLDDIAHSSSISHPKRTTGMSTNPTSYPRKFPRILACRTFSEREIVYSHKMRWYSSIGSMDNTLKRRRGGGCHDETRWWWNGDFVVGSGVMVVGILQRERQDGDWEKDEEGNESWGSWTPVSPVDGRSALGYGVEGPKFVRSGPRTRDGGEGVDLEWSRGGFGDGEDVLGWEGFSKGSLSG